MTVTDINGETSRVVFDPSHEVDPTQLSAVVQMCQDSVGCDLGQVYGQTDPLGLVGDYLPVDKCYEGLINRTDLMGALRTYQFLQRCRIQRACILTRELFDYQLAEEGESFHETYKKGILLAFLHHWFGPDIAAMAATCGGDLAAGKQSERLSSRASRASAAGDNARDEESRSKSIPLQVSVKALRAIGRMGWTDNIVYSLDTPQRSIPDLVAVEIGQGRYRTESFDKAKVLQRCLPDDAIVVT